MKRNWEQKMDAEMRFHLECLIEDYVAQGMSRGEAEQRARREFGAMELAKDECRDGRRARWLAVLWGDIRYACRGLLRKPAFAIAAVLTLALGIGANTSVFSAVYAGLLRPLPYHEPDRIHSVDIVIPERASQFPSMPVTVQIFHEWRRAATALGGITALRPWECNLSGDGEPERLGGARVAANFFQFLGVPIARGRGFVAKEEEPGNERVVVISDALWRRRYGGDAGVVGHKLDINGEPHTIIGVASPHMLAPVQTQLHALLPFAPRVDIWKPLAPTARELQGESWDHGVLVRLRPGQDAAVVSDQLRTIVTAWLAVKEPVLKIDLRPQLTPIREIYSGKIRLRLLLVLAAAGLLLLTACANVANLFLARAASRRAEFSTRIALGAGWARVVSQMVAETLVIALCGGALGIVTASAGARLLSAVAPAEFLGLGGVDPAALLFALAASFVTALVCGAIPAWSVYRQDAVRGLRESGRAAMGGGMRTRQALVGVQIALSTLLLASAGLLLRSFVNVMGADRGYAVERVMAVDLSLFGPRQDAAGFYRTLAESARALPGVEAAGVINDLPATAGSTGASRTIFHSADADFQKLVLQRPVAMVRSVTSGYFAASGTRLRAGRHLLDQEPAPVALISESLARALWPGEPVEAVVGRAIRQGDVSGPLVTIVGVAQDVRAGAVERELPPFLYRPYGQWASGPATLVMRSSLEPVALSPAIRAEIRKLRPNLPVPPLRTMREIVSESVAQRRFQALLTGLFALIAVLLAAVGVFGVVSYSVTCRTREIGLRVALGATRGDVMRWVLLSGIRPVLLGIVAGACGAMITASLMRGLLYGVTPFDPYSVSAVIALLLGCAGVACYLPARRASRLDPMTALGCQGH